MESNPVLKGKKNNNILPLSKYRYSRDCCETFDIWMAYPDALTGVMDLPQSIQSQVFSEILDDDVQKGILFLYVPYLNFVHCVKCCHSFWFLNYNI